MTRDEAHRKIKADYEAILGRIILVLELTGYKDDDSHDFRMDPPVKARVVRTREDDLFHCVDKEWIDPYWDLELVEPHPRLEGYISFWMYGTSYNIATDATDLARFEEISQELTKT